MTHHQSILGTFALIGTTLYLDRTRLTFRMVLLAALPIALMAAGWAIYAMERPDYFRAQIASNGAGRLHFFRKPLETLEWEFTRRYFFYGFTADDNPLRRVLALVPLAWAAALFIAWLAPAIRRMPGVVLIQGICVVQAIYQATLDGNKLHLYLIHVLPYMTVLLALVLYGLWHARMAPRILLTGFVLVWAAVGLGSSAALIKNNNFEEKMHPLRQLLQRRTPAGSSIYGSPELGIYIGFEYLVDDLRLGFGTGKVPDYIVMDRRINEWLEKNRATEPAVVQRASAILDKAEVIYHSPDYQLYRVTKTGT